MLIGISGFVEIFNSKMERLFEKKNTILPFGKYKIV